MNGANMTMIVAGHIPSVRSNISQRNVPAINRRRSSASCENKEQRMLCG